MTEAKSETVKQPPEGAATEKKLPEAGPSVDAKLQDDLNIAFGLPIPSQDEYWHLDSGSALDSGKLGILGIFRRKELSEEELSNLRQEAETAPGRARVKIQMLRKKFAFSSSLAMLSALCTHRMIKNSANQKGVLNGLKSASKESAYALLKDGLSLYNTENFFNIYFEYLAKLKRFQISTFKTLTESGSMRSARDRLAIAVKICGRLLDEKDRAYSILTRIKGKFKSSSYILPWLFTDILMAAKKVEQGDPKAVCGPADARETLAYTLALVEIFARIPILYPLVDSILALIPESNNTLYLRKTSVMTTRLFTQLEASVQAGDLDRMRSIGRQIFKTASESVHRINNQPIRQSFEADPYFHLGRVALLTFGAFESKEQKIIMLTSIKAMNKVVKLDVSKNHAYTESASTMVKKLSNLMPE